MLKATITSKEQDYGNGNLGRVGNRQDVIRTVTREDNMPDYVRGADLSRWQQRPDFGALVAAGISFVALKATENLSLDPDFAWNRDEAAKRNIPALAYAFLRPTDTDATIDHFLEVTGGMVPALDWEAAGVDASIVERWMGRCEAKLGRPGLAYYGLYPPMEPPTTKIATWPRWFPQYPGNDTAGARLPAWDGTPNPDWRKCWLIWQWSGGALLPDLPGKFDLNRLSPGCSLDSFKAWIATGQFSEARPSDPPTIAAPVLPASPEPLAIPDAKALQAALKAAGRYDGQPDGIWGPRSAAALSAYYAGR